MISKDFTMNAKKYSLKTNYDSISRCTLQHFANIIIYDYMSSNTK